LLAVLVFLVFGQTAGQEFVNYDDNFYVYANPTVTSGLSPSGVLRALSQKTEGLWTPLVTVSHMFDWQLYGSWAGGHHLTNVALHLGSVILLFLILLQMTTAPWRSAFVAALFAIHPLHVESVAWISERKDVLSGLFFMLTLGAYLRYVQRPASAGRYLAVIFLFAIGLMCKPMIVTLPCVLLLLDYWPLKRLFVPPSIGSDPSNGLSIQWRVVVEKLPMLALSAGWCAAAVLGPERPVIDQGERIPFWARVCEAPAWLVTYLGQMIWPARLAVVYTHYETSLPWWPAALALVAAFSLGIFLLRGKHPYLWMGWLWNLGMLMPALGFSQISRHARADHYTYLPQIGLYIGLTWLAADWAAERPPRRVALGAIALAALSALSVAAWRQTGVWRDSITLWTHALGCTRDNYMAHGNLGSALLLQGQTQEAIDECREALRINPVLPGAHNDLGIGLFRQGQAEQGIVQFREALRLDPGFAEAHCNLGNALIATGRNAEGLAEFHEALRIDPAYQRAHLSLGKALLAQGKTDAAIAELREALRIKPSDARAHDILGAALLERGQAQEGIAEFSEALKLNPADAEARNSIAKAMPGQGPTGAALDETQKAQTGHPLPDGQ
jgi:Flp pilus assembly protein TadD